LLHSHEYAATAEELALVGISIAMDKTVELEITKDGDVAVAAFKSGCISDVEGITAAGRQIKQFVNDNRSSKLVFDFAEVKFFSSQVLGLLLDVRANLQRCGGEVVISAINPQLHRVFKITNLDKIFRFFKDRQSAVKTITAD